MTQAAKGASTAAMASPDPEQLLLHSAAGVVASCGPPLRVLRGSVAILVVGDSIREIGKSSSLLQRAQAHNAILTPDSPHRIQLLDLSRRWIIPGLINTHVHTSQQLGRGIADDVDLLTWLHKRIWPYEAAMSEQDSYISTLLCCVELIRSGVTCFAEAGGQHVAGMVRAVEEAGLRACLARSTMDSGSGLPPPWANTCAEREISEQEELHRRFNGAAGGRIRIWLGLRQILNATDSLLCKTRDLAHKLDTGIHMHVAEIAYENQHVQETRQVEQGQGTVTHLSCLQCLSPRLLAAHSVWVSPQEVQLLAQQGVSAVHCPGSAMRMLGFAPVSQMLQAGVNVSLGTDGAPSNNRMSMVDEMYLAALVNKGKEAYQQGTTDPTALPACTVLRMATINGARSLHWDSDIGSLEEGKKADLVVVDPNNFSMTPLHDPVSSLVYSMRTENIESVMCNGKWLMRDRTLVTLDEGDILRRATAAAQALVQKAGIELPSPAGEFLEC